LKGLKVALHGDCYCFACVQQMIGNVQWATSCQCHPAMRGPELITRCRGLRWTLRRR